MIHGVYGLYAIYRHNHVSTMLNALAKKGLSTWEFYYPKFFVLDTYNMGLVSVSATKLKEILKDGDSIVSHSFGGAIVYELLRLLETSGSTVKLHNIYLFNIALDKFLEVPTANCNHVYNFYDPSDKLLALAELLPFDLMGEFGKHPYFKMDDRKVTNVEIDNALPTTITNHARAFNEPGLSIYSKYIAEKEDRNA